MDINPSQMKRVQDLTNVLEKEVDLQKQVHCIELLIFKFMPSMDLNQLEDDIFCIVLPTTRELINKICEDNINIITSCRDESSAIRITDQLEMITKLLQTINLILNFISTNGILKVSLIKSVPVNISHLLYSTFLHCKESSHMYKNFFNSLDPILQVFKNAQEIHVKFLKALENNIEFILEFDDEKELLLEVFDIICDIGQISQNVNAKLMTDTWKTYTLLFQKYKQGLKNDFKIVALLEFIATEILKNMNAAYEVSDLKVVTHSMKISNFLLKIATKIFELFKGPCRKSHKAVLLFFSTLYSFPERFLEQKSLDESILNLIEYHIFQPIEPILIQFITEGAILEADSLEDFSTDKLTGFLFFSSIILPKVNLEGNFGITFNYLKCILFCIEKDEIIKTRDTIIENVSVYTNLLVNIVAKILSTNYSEFESIEELLIQQMMEGSTWASEMSCDIWTLTLRHAPPTYAYDNIITVIQEILKIGSFDLKFNKKFKILLNLRKLHHFLPSSLRCKLLEKYSPEAYMNIWAILGFQSIPSSKSFLVNATIQNFGKRINEIDSRKFTEEDLTYLVDSLEVFSTISFTDTNDIVKLTENVMKLWKFNLSDELYEGSFFPCFITGLCSVTVKLIRKLNSTQLFQVLTQLNSLLEHDESHYIKMYTSEFLISLSKQNIKEQSIINPTVSLIKVAIKDNNPILKSIAQETENIFSNNNAWAKYLRDYNPEEKKIALETENISLNNNSCAKYSHGNNPEENKVPIPPRIPSPTNVVPAAKKIKLEEGEVQDVLDHIQDEVKLLNKYARQGKILNEHSKIIFQIINKLNKLI